MGLPQLSSLPSQGPAEKADAGLPGRQEHQEALGKRAVKAH